MPRFPSTATSAIGLSLKRFNCTCVSICQQEGKTNSALSDQQADCLTGLLDLACHVRQWNQGATNLQDPVSNQGIATASTLDDLVKGAPAALLG